ncbi:SsgA family sporulation/cell division regulator [Streptomyces sp. NPDC050560]|uniref:SsgA family sporulation/cell division regulator n=1 Tax=Streptomyces sp. NPDC050560 TaxID=3365630 RepID=UPI0037895961
MSFAVEQHARAQVVSGTAEELPDVPVHLRYDPDAGVCLSFAESPGAPAHDWVFARELLEKGLLAPADDGDVRIWPAGRVRAVVEFHSPGGVSVVEFDSWTLNRFLRSTYAAATAAPSGAGTAGN